MGAALRTLWDQSPAVTRLLCTVYVALTALVPLVLQKAVPSLSEHLICCLYTFLRQRHVWTIFTSLVFRPSHGVWSFLLVILECWICLSGSLAAREKDLGSLRFFLWVLLTTAACNMLFLLSMFVLTETVGPQFFLQMSQGLWPLVLVSMTLRALLSPRELVNVWGLFNIESKYYPLAMIGFLCLLNGRVLWDVAAAVAIGYAHDKFQLERLLPSPSQAARIEQGLFGKSMEKCLGLMGGWVPALRAGNFEELPTRRYATLTEFRNATQRFGAPTTAAPPRGGPEGFQAFGGTGRRLGA